MCQRDGAYREAARRASWRWWLQGAGGQSGEALCCGNPCPRVQWPLVPCRTELAWGPGLGLSPTSHCPSHRPSRPRGLLAGPHLALRLHSLSLSLSCTPTPTLGPPSDIWLPWTLAATRAGSLSPWTVPDRGGGHALRVTGTDPSGSPALCTARPPVPRASRPCSPSPRARLSLSPPDGPGPAQIRAVGGSGQAGLRACGLQPSQRPIVLARDRHSPQDSEPAPAPRPGPEPLLSPPSKET